MTDIIRAGSEAELKTANENNYLSYTRTYSNIASSEFIENETLMMSVSAVNGVSMVNNCVSKSRINESDVGEILKTYKLSGRPVMWMVSPSSEPSNIREILKNKKLMHIDHYSVMHCDMTGFDEYVALAEGLEIQAVETIDVFRSWVELYTASFGLTSGIEKITIDEHAPLFLDKDIPGRHFIAFYKGKPVGTASVFVSDGVAGIYNITTAPGARGKGVGEAVTRRAMIEGIRYGCVFATLQATKAGQSVYEKIGFEVVDSIDVYVKMYGKSRLTLPATLVKRTLESFGRNVFFRI